MIHSTSTINGLNRMRLADEVKTFPMLEMAPQQLKTSTSAASLKVSTRRQQLKDAIVARQDAVRKEKLVKDNSQNLLPGILRTKKPPTVEFRNLEYFLEKANAADQPPNQFTMLHLDGKTAPLPNRSTPSSSAGGVGLPQNNTTTGVRTKTPGTSTGKMGVVHIDGKSLLLGEGSQKYDPAMEELRKYTVLMDDYSLHQFVIYGGQTLKETPEFESFRRTHAHEWGAISDIVKLLEDFVRIHDIKLAIIDGPRVYAIASLNLSAVSNEDLMSCISNVEELKRVIGSLRDASLTKEERATIKIQSHVRRMQEVQRFRLKLKQIFAAVLIQCHIRKMLGRQRVVRMLRERKDSHDDRWSDNVEVLKRRWSEISSLYAANSSGTGTGTMTQTKTMMATNSTSEITSSTRLMIFIPSISVGEYIRLSMSNIPALVNMQIACLYMLADPNVHILYVSPVQVTPAELAYHSRFLEAIGVQRTSKRMHFIVPELILRLPQHLPLSQMLWCSTSALKKLRIQVRPYKNVVIVPTAVSWMERKLSNILNIPLLSPDPHIAETVQSRSFAKQVFIDASVNIPIGSHDIKSHSDFMVALTRLISCNIDVNRWIFRLNHDYNNETLAYFDTDRLSVTPTLRHEYDQLLSAENIVGPWFSRPVQVSVRKRVMHALKAELTRKIVFAQPDVIPTLEVFYKYMRQHGCVIEAEPLEYGGTVLGLCFIDPNGNIEVKEGVEVLADSKYKAQAYIGPQSITPRKALSGATQAVARYLYTNFGAIGYLTVEFMSYWDSLDEMPRLAAIGFRFGMHTVFSGMSTAAVTVSPGMRLPPSGLADVAKGKFFVYIPYACHRPLSGTRDDAFFKFCRMKSIGYDKESHTGTLFFLVDQIVGGVISVLCIGNSYKRALEIAMLTMNFVVDQFGKDSVENMKSWDNVSNIQNQIRLLLKRRKIQAQSGDFADTYRGNSSAFRTIENTFVEAAAATGTMANNWKMGGAHNSNNHSNPHSNTGSPTIPKSR